MVFLLDLIRYYSRKNCALCEKGLQIVRIVQEDVPFQLEIVDIESDQALHEKFMLMIPVVEMNGEIVQYGQIDYPTLLDALL